MPGDGLVALTLGAFRLAGGDAEGAARLFGPLAPVVAEATVGLAEACLAMGDRDGAALALSEALRLGVVSDRVVAVAERVGLGWCGLGGEGRLRFGGAGLVSVRLDGVIVDPEVPVGGGDWLAVEGAGGQLLGSPLPLGRLRAVQGVVMAEADGLAGWAWCPADPERAIELVVRGPWGMRAITAGAPAEGVEGLPPLAQPRRFVVAGAVCDALGEPIAVVDGAGRALFGSPVWRGREPVLGPVVAARFDLAPRAVDVVIPVHGGAAETMACLASVLATVPAGSVVHVVDDGSPDAGVRDGVRGLAAAGLIRLHAHAENRGFPAAANTGLRAAAGRDVVLLNSDTVVPPGWVERLRAAAYHADDVGSATPLTGDGSIVSYGGTGEGLDEVARVANAELVAALPVGVGFCLYLRRDCLDQVGALREDLFAQGYGEESEFCLRARRCGWRHVAALDLFVAHRGGVSFGAGLGGAGRGALQRRNQAILERSFSNYAGLIASFHADDPLFAARRRMDAVLWARGRLPSAVLLVSHGAGGGVAEMVAGRTAALREAGVRPVVIVPADGGCRVEEFGDLRFAVPGELPALAALLGGDRPTHLEVHHLLGHDHAVIGLARLLGIGVEHWVHDASSFCPRIALIGRGRRYCGEPGVDGCEACVAALGSNLEEAIGPGALVARSAADFAAARRVVVPTADTGRRLRRHFPGVRPEVVPWEADGGLLPVEAGVAGRICVVGAIGVEKGYDVLLECVADAGRRGLRLDFVVCGQTEDDERLMAAGPAFVTGRYATGEAVGLIRAQGAAVAFIPSIWPETWCFALSRAWEAGLAAVAFDLGAPAERIRATGRGQLLPLGLPAGRVNDALVRLARGGAGLQPLRVT